jgi:K+-sensing histidine kinase KdpD
VGLGLALTRSVVKEHGGDITLANRKGGGLIVRVVLPVSKLPDATKAQAIASAELKPEPNSSKAAA